MNSNYLLYHQCKKPFLCECMIEDLTEQSSNRMMEKVKEHFEYSELDTHEIAYYAVRGTDRDPEKDVKEVEGMIKKYASSREQKYKKLLRKLKLALDDWTRTYAPEFCSGENVLLSKTRIAENGGTLAYIAELRQEIDNLEDDKTKD